jgi:hypothetical protein
MFIVGVGFAVFLLFIPFFVVIFLFYIHTVMLQCRRVEFVRRSIDYDAANTPSTVSGRVATTIAGYHGSISEANSARALLCAQFVRVLAQRHPPSCVMRARHAQCVSAHRWHTAEALQRFDELA